MNSQLRISIRMLGGRYHGDDWPPSPARLFQALVAGANTGCRVLEWQQARAALVWLEKQDPPAIIAPEIRQGFAYKSFAPNNDSDSRKVVALVQSGRRLPDAMRAEGMITTKHHAPRLLDAGQGQGEDATIHYLWPLRAPLSLDDRAQAGEICRLARHVLALGWGLDLAIGDGRVSAEPAALPPGRHYIPCWSGGGTSAKTPCVGYLADLERAYGAFRRRTQGGAVDADTHPRAYRPVPYRLADSPSARIAVPFDLLDAQGEERRSFRWEDGMVVSAWMRHAARKRFLAEGWEQSRVDSYVCGHTSKGEENHRLSYVPLPSIGHQHSDAQHRRALVVLPFDDDCTDETLAILYRMAGDPLRALGYDRPVGRLGDGKRDAVVMRYLGESTLWLTVTPVILHGRDYDAGRFSPRKADKLLLQAFAESGYPADQIETFSYQAAPLWTGAGAARQAAVPKHLAQWPRYHVRVQFRTALSGPVLVGIGRHYGLGVFASVPSQSGGSTEIGHRS